MPLSRSRYLWAILDASRMKTETVVPVEPGRPSRTNTSRDRLQRQRRYRRFAGEYCLAALGLAGFGEVEGPVDTPEGANAKGDIRFLHAHAADRERSDQVEQLASQISHQPEQ